MAADLSILISAVNKASGVFKDVGSDANSLGGTFGKLGGTMGAALKVGGLAAAGGIVAAGFAIKGMVSEAMEAQAVMAQTEAVIKSTGGAAGLTAEQIGKIASSLSRETTFADDAIQSAQNMLLTFTNIGKNVFPEATETVLNMSTALGQDLQSSAVQLGKALNDPIAGVTALRKVGVALTDQQKEQIKVLVESGDVMGAQKIILKELATEFGGSAQAQAEIFSGRIKQLSNSIGEVKEGIGMALLPALTKLADLAAVHVVPAIERTVAAASDFGMMIRAALTGDVEKAAEMFNRLPGPLQAVATWLAANRDRIEEMAMKAKDIAIVIGGVLLDSLKGWVKVFQELGPKLVEFGQFLADHKPLMIALGIVVGLLVVALIGIPAVIAGIIIAGGLLAAHWDEIKAKVLELRDSFQENFGFLYSVVVFVFELIKNYIQTTVLVIKDIFTIVMALIRGDWGKAWDGIKQLAADVLAGIVTDFRLKFGMMLDVVKFVGQLILNWFAELPGMILEALGDLADLLYDIGLDILAGLWDGMKAKWEDVSGWVTDIGGKIADGFKGALGIRSPSSIMIPIGASVIQGLQVGMENESHGLFSFMDDLAARIGAAAARIREASAAASGPAAGTNTFTGEETGRQGEGPRQGPTRVGGRTRNEWIYIFGASGIPRDEYMGRIREMFGYRMGTNYVPEDQWAYLHKGEKVVTAEAAARGEGGSSVINYITNWYQTGGTDAGYAALSSAMGGA